MKKSIFTVCLIGAVLCTSTGACTDQILSEIDSNPNRPSDVPLELLLPQVTLAVPSGGVAASDLAMKMSVFVEHSAGVFDRYELIDKRAAIVPGMSDGDWAGLYSILNDLQIIINKAEEESSPAYAGIAKILYAYSIVRATDLWGRAPNSEALQGSENRTPAPDDQQEIYAFAQDFLDKAIADLDKPSVKTPGKDDLIFGGNLPLWKKTAWGLKARFYNRLSKRMPTESAELALDALANSFTSPDEGFIFDSYSATPTEENPFFQERGSASSPWAVSQSMFDIMERLDDPRIEIFFAPLGGDSSNPIVPAPNGAAEEDQSRLGVIYSKPSPEIINAAAPIPMLTYDELKFIEAEAQLRLGNPNIANEANEEAVVAALRRAGVSEEDIITYTSQADVFPGAENPILRAVMSMLA